MMKTTDMPAIARANIITAQIPAKLKLVDKGLNLRLIMMTEEQKTTNMPALAKTVMAQVLAKLNLVDNTLDQAIAPRIQELAGNIPKET